MHHNTQIEFPSSPREEERGERTEILEIERKMKVRVCANLSLITASAMILLSNVDSNPIVNALISISPNSN